MSKLAIRTMAAALCSLVAPWCSADSYCSETVTAVVMHTNGNVYFNTSGTCVTNWCQISFSSPTANNQAYALLLTAVASGQSVAFDWPNVTSCTQQNVLYASPGFAALVTH